MLPWRETQENQAGGSSCLLPGHEVGGPASRPPGQVSLARHALDIEHFSEPPLGLPRRQSQLAAGKYCGDQPLETAQLPLETPEEVVSAGSSQGTTWRTYSSRCRNPKSSRVRELMRTTLMPAVPGTVSVRAAAPAGPARGTCARPRCRCGQSRHRTTRLPRHPDPRG